MVVLGDLTKYGAIMAKVSVMKRGLLTRDDYIALINKRSVAELTSYLKNETSYGPVLETVNENDVHRGELERLMNNALIEDVVKLYRFDNGENQKFYTYVFIRAEIEILKLMLRRLSNDEADLGWAAEVPEFFRKHFTINLDLLSKSTTLKELLENLSGSRYESVIAPLLSLKEHQNLLSVEMTLDMYYYSVVDKLKAELTDIEDRKLLDETVGSEVDMLNLLWIYRCKKYFDMPKELIYSFIIPNKYKLGKKTIMELVEAPSAEDFLEVVKRTPYRNTFVREAGEFFERSYKKFVYRMHQKKVKECPFSIESAISYLHFKEFEIDNLTSIIEGIRYGLSPDEIKPYVVGFDLD